MSNNKISAEDKKKYAEKLVSEVIKLEEDALNEVNQVKATEMIAKISHKFEEVYAEYENQENDN